MGRCHNGPAGHVLAEEVRLIVDTVTRIDVSERSLTLATGDAVGYDSLVYALGSHTADPDVPGRPTRCSAGSPVRPQHLSLWGSSASASAWAVAPASSSSPTVTTTATGLHLSGRPGATLKQLVCWVTVKQLATEARKPGSFSMPGWVADGKRPGKLAAGRGAGAAGVGPDPLRRSTGR